MTEYTNFSEDETVLREQMGLKLTEHVLDHVSNNPHRITLKELIQLVKMAYPDDV